MSRMDFKLVKNTDNLYMRFNISTVFQSTCLNENLEDKDLKSSCVMSILTSGCPQSGDRFLLKMMAGAAVTRTEKSVRIGVRMARRSWCLLILNRDTSEVQLLPDTVSDIIKYTFMLLKRFQYNKYNINMNDNIIQTAITRDHLISPNLVY